MKIVNSTLRAIIERVTELEWLHKGETLQIYVFEHLDERGVAAKQWIQNWHCDDVSHIFGYEERKKITETLYEFYKSKASSAD